MNLFYRQIQILNSTFNRIESHQLVIFLVCFGGAQITSVLQLFRRSDSETGAHSQMMKYWISGFYFMIMFFVTLAINFLFGCCGQVHASSLKTLAYIKHRKKVNEPKLFTKLVASYSVIKIKFGSTNFIEKITPVTFQLFLIQRIVDALLIK